MKQMEEEKGTAQIRLSKRTGDNPTLESDKF